MARVNVSGGPYSGKPYSELMGLRKDYAKMAQTGVAVRKEAERQLSMIAMAMTTCEDTPTFEASDHAVVRYLERVKGVDITAIREEMALECANAKEVCGDRIRSANGAIFCLNAEGFITTVLPMDAVLDGVRGQAAFKEGLRPNPARRRQRKAIRAVLADLSPITGE